MADIADNQEVFLRVLAFLDARDLVSVQGVSKYWARMSLDPQLWKRLYLSRYPHPHHSKLIYRPSIISPSPGRPLRPIARLPSRAFPPPSPSRSPSATPRRDDSASGSQTPVPSGKVEGIGTAKVLASREETDEIGTGVRNDGVDWKMMLRLGTNWSNGNALSQATVPLPPSPSLSATSQSQLAESPSAGITSPPRPPPYSEQHIALFPSFIFTSNPTSPLVHVYPASTHPSRAAPLGVIPPPPGWSSPSRPDNVTAICADQSVALPDEPAVGSTKPALPARLAVFYESGGFVVLRVRLMPSIGTPRIAWSRESIHPAQTRPKSLRRRATTFSPLDGDPVVLASMHYPVLITCTLAFHLSFFTLSPPDPSGSAASGTPSRPKHLQTMHSDVSFHPAALSLFPAHSDEIPPIAETTEQVDQKHFRAGLTYCTPLYPASWTVAVQEFGIDLEPTMSLEAEARLEELGLSGGGQVWRGECWHVGRGDDDEDDKLVWPRRNKPVVGVRGKRAVGIGTDGRWCVLAGGDNQIQVYSLPTPTPTPSPPPGESPSASPILRASLHRVDKSGSKTPPIVHSQTLLAHHAEVTSLSLSAGRCVSGGRDGRVLVWELDEDLESEGDGRVGRTVGYVEVKSGGRRAIWRGAAGPDLSAESKAEAFTTEVGGKDEDELSGGQRKALGVALPHPQSISSAARSLFLPRPPIERDEQVEPQRPSIRHLAFDEEKIVGLVSDPSSGGGGGEVMKVWSFNG
ncbi:hypothetical protein JCM24511_07823 [Saitozyma sp. JCM 24511]|nr:hypothetical protein JCM24511_07823 [Saitozyma sp. JCM 24511]